MINRHVQTAARRSVRFHLVDRAAPRAL